MAARKRRDNALMAALAVLAVLGGGHAIFSFFDSNSTPSTDDSTTVAIGHAQLVGSFAERFVVTYLSAGSAQQEQLKEFVATDHMTLPSDGRAVSNPSVVYLSREIFDPSLDVWSVTVSVDADAAQAPARKGTATQAGTSSKAAGSTGSAAAISSREYYRVPVTLSQGRMRALTLPAMVEPPGQGDNLGQVYESACTAETPLAQVASGFISTFLTGSGDIARYTVLGSPIAALRPAPFTAVEVVAVDADDNGCGETASVAHVQVMLDPETASGKAATMTYPLTLVRNNGQWQVRSMDSIPALANPLTVIAKDRSSNSATDSGSTTATPSTPPSSVAQIPPATQK